ncbi:hypothetical protein RFI_17886, partial [Reticulomyxa filosa]
FSINHIKSIQLRKKKKKGLALDYEIFLYSRVFEYRSKKFDGRSSILLAVSSTGPIISAAGTVMAMAFFGLLLEVKEHAFFFFYKKKKKYNFASTIPAVSQMGYVFVFGVLVDTFVIRPLLTPSILSLVDWLNWWPTKMPTENLRKIPLHTNMNNDDSSVWISGDDATEEQKGNASFTFRGAAAASG